MDIGRRASIFRRPPNNVYNTTLAVSLELFSNRSVKHDLFVCNGDERHFNGYFMRNTNLITFNASV